MRGCTKEGCGIVRGGNREGPHASGRHKVCYTIPNKAKVEVSDVIITSMVLVCHRSASILFDLGFTCSYVSTNFAYDFDIIFEPFVEPICVSTSVSESLVVNRVYRGCIVTFTGRDVIADLILLNMVDFNMILGMEWMSPYHAILVFHVKIITLSCLDLP